MERALCRKRWLRIGAQAAGCGAFLYIAGLDIALRHGWISLTWPQAEAVITAVPPHGERRSGFRESKGYPYPVGASVQTAEGRSVEARMLEPLTSVHSNLRPVPDGVIGPPPRVGDRLVVHLHPAGDGRAMPRENLRDRTGSLMIFGSIALIILLNLLRDRWRGWAA